MELSSNNLTRASSINGVVIGVLSFLIGIVSYYAFPAMLGSIYFGIGTLVVSILIYIFFTLDLRRKIGGYWSFREALKGIFLMVFVAGLLYSVANLLFYKFIEPNAYEKVSGYVEEGLASSLERMGMDQEEVDAIVSKQAEGIRAQFNPTIGQFLKNFAIGILFQFIMALIFAAIFKKEHPVFMETGDQINK